MAFENEKPTNPDLEAMWVRAVQELAPRARTVLDVGCRYLRVSGEIASRFREGFYGVDVNPEAIELARSKAIPGVHLACAGETDFGRCFGRRFDLVLASCVVYHLRDELVAEFFQALSRDLLGDKGIALANVNTTQDPGRWGDFPFVRKPLSFYEDQARLAGLTLIDRGPITAFGYTPQNTTATNIMIELRRARA